MNESEKEELLKELVKSLQGKLIQYTNDFVKNEIMNGLKLDRGEFAELVLNAASKYYSNVFLKVFGMTNNCSVSKFFEININGLREMIARDEPELKEH